MKVLAIDPGGSMGWALYEDGKITSGVERLTQKPKEHVGIRFVRLEAFLQQFPVLDLLLWEKVQRHLGVDAAHAYGAYTGFLKWHCVKNTIPFEMLHVQTIKNFALGKNRAGDRKTSKQQMTQAAESLFQKPMATDDESDANWILACGLAVYKNIQLKVSQQLEGGTLFKLKQRKRKLKKKTLDRLKRKRYT